MTFFLLLIFPITNALAYDFTDGYFDSNPPTISDNRVIDNNLGTKIIIFNGNSPFIITLKESIDIKAFYLVGLRKESTVKFYDASGKVIATIGGSQFLSGYNDLVLRGVKKIDFNNTYGDANLFEFELFEKESIVYAPVTDLKESHNHSEITLNWENPVGSEFRETIIKSNEGVIANILSPTKTYTIKNLKPGTSYDFEVVAEYSDDGYSDSVSISAKTDTAPIVKDLKATTNHNSANLTWELPTVNDITGIRVLKEGVKVADISKVSKYEITGLKPETTYKYEIVILYSGFESAPVPITFTTLKTPDDAGEINDLKATATHERVDLSWSLPKTDVFKHVNIYRDTIKETALIDKLLGVQTVYAAETKIFETNGTYFNDLTVSPSTTYEYTLTTTSTGLTESEGISAKVTTAAKPKPSIGGGGYEEDKATGDFTYTWTSPTTGQVKVMVGGVLFKTVAASDLKIVIPKGSMKFTLLGSPDVKLIPIAEDGTEGVPTKPPSNGGIGGGGVDIPFSPNDLLKSGMGLMLIVGPFVLLAMAFLLVPKLRNVIVQAFNQKKGQPTTGRRFNA